MVFHYAYLDGGVLVGLGSVLVEYEAGDAEGAACRFVRTGLWYHKRGMGLCHLNQPRPCSATDFWLAGWF